MYLICFFQFFKYTQILFKYIMVKSSNAVPKIWLNNSWHVINALINLKIITWCSKYLYLIRNAVFYSFFFWFVLNYKRHRNPFLWKFWFCESNFVLLKYSIKNNNFWLWYYWFLMINTQFPFTIFFFCKNYRIACWWNGKTNESFFQIHS